MRLITTCLLYLCAGLAQAAWDGHNGNNGHGDAPRTWTELPLIEATPGRGRMLATFRLANLEAASVKAFAPGGQAPLPEGLRFKSERQEWDILLENGRFTLQSLGVGNYHWLQAREETRDRIVTASTVHYFAIPGPAPTAMLQASKAELEVAPQPFPREHWKYRAGETWAFLVRFNGQPLADAKLRLETSGGTQQVLATDTQGMARVTFPADFKPARDDHGGGHHGREPENRFVLAVGHTDREGRHYLSAFNYKYAQSDETDKSLNAGLGFLMLGGLIGLPLVLGRAKEKKHG